MRKLIFERLLEKIGNSGVLVLLLFTLFVIPIIKDPGLRRTIFSAMLTVIFLMGVLAMEKYKRFIFWMAVIALITEWISFVLQIPLLVTLSQTTNILFFMLIVARFIAQIARRKEVDAKVIIESINGYLLLGLAYGIIVSVIHRNVPNAFKFPEGIGPDLTSITYLNDYIYYTFVTFTTLGYGDITPLAPISKSLSLLISISGQFYIAIIIAMLVGKYASRPQKS